MVNRISTGKLINFYLPFIESGQTVSADDQARAVLEKSRALLAGGSKGVGIIYSANYGQTRTIVETYRQGEWRTRIDGANQASVMRQMETLMSADPYQSLRGKLRIMPITTIDAYEGDHAFQPWNEDVHQSIVKSDLERIQQYLEDGWDILGWQNQTTLKDADHPYTIGDGIAVVSPWISNTIQRALNHFSREYHK